jgi:EmrB/QacA subfamily drug resistance transporter
VELASQDAAWYQEPRDSSSDREIEQPTARLKKIKVSDWFKEPEPPPMEEDDEPTTPLRKVRVSNWFRVQSDPSLTNEVSVRPSTSFLGRVQIADWYTDWYRQPLDPALDEISKAPTSVLNPADAAAYSEPVNPALEAISTVQTTILSKVKAANPWLALLALSFGLVMSLLDSTVVNIATGSIKESFQVSLPLVSWVLNSYNLVFALLLITVGHFADQYGRKLVFQIAMVVFTAGSFFCGIAPLFGWLIASRVFQAAGAAGLNSISLAIINVVFPQNKRGAAIGVWGALAGLAATLGPMVGGLVVSQLGWRWIFFMNLPFCLVGIVLVSLWVPETRSNQGRVKLDVIGLALLIVSTFSLVLAIIQSSVWEWRIILILAGMAVVGFGLLVFVEKRQAHPIIDIKLLALRNFFTTNLATFLYSIAVQGAVLILVLYFTIGRGFPPFYGAIAVLPLSLSVFFISALSGFMSGKLSSRSEGIIGMSLLSGGLLLLCFMPFNASYFDTAWRECIIGVGMGLSLISFPKKALQEVPAAKLGVGSGVFNTFRQIGYALGVAILLSLVSSLSQPASKVIHASLQGQTFHAYQATWLIASIIAALGLICMFFTNSKLAAEQKGK